MPDWGSDWAGGRTAALTVGPPGGNVAGPAGCLPRPPAIVPVRRAPHCSCIHRGAALQTRP